MTHSNTLDILSWKISLLGPAGSTESQPPNRNALVPITENEWPDRREGATPSTCGLLHTSWYRARSSARLSLVATGPHGSAPTAAAGASGGGRGDRGEPASAAAGTASPLRDGDAGAPARAGAVGEPSAPPAAAAAALPAAAAGGLPAAAVALRAGPPPMAPLRGDSDRSIRPPRRAARPARPGAARGAAPARAGRLSRTAARRPARAACLARAHAPDDLAAHANRWASCAKLQSRRVLLSLPSP